MGTISNTPTNSSIPVPSLSLKKIAHPTLVPSPAGDKCINGKQAVDERYADSGPQQALGWISVRR
jgi:hypothetical protein